MFILCWPNSLQLVRLHFRIVLLRKYGADTPVHVGLCFKPKLTCCCVVALLAALCVSLNKLHSLQDQFVQFCQSLRYLLYTDRLLVPTVTLYFRSFGFVVCTFMYCIWLYFFLIFSFSTIHLWDISLLWYPYTATQDFFIHFELCHSLGNGKQCTRRFHLLCILATKRLSNNNSTQSYIYSKGWIVTFILLFIGVSSSPCCHLSFTLGLPVTSLSPTEGN